MKRKNVQLIQFIAITVLMLTMASSIQADTSNIENLAGDFPLKVISSVRIDIDGTKLPPEYWEQLARDLIGIKEGDTISGKNLSEALERLSVSRQFSMITVKNISPDDALVALHFHLTVFRRIKKIKIKGNYPFFKKDIHKVMTVRVGDPFTSKLVQNQRELIMSLYEKEGFYNPKVSIMALIDKTDGHYRLEIRINRGPNYWIKRVNISGNNTFREKKLLGFLKTWKKSFLPKTASRFTEDLLMEDLERLRAFYLKKRYCDITIDHRIETNPEKGVLSIHINIEEGLPYRISFEGNKFFSSKRLNKELSLFEKGQNGASGIRKGIKNIKTLYMENGFANVRVVRKDLGEVVYRKKKEIHVQILITEDKQCKIDQVTITGAIHQEKGALFEKMGLPYEGPKPGTLFNEELVTDGIYNIKSFYLEKGYPETQVESNIIYNEDKSRATVKLTISEGIQTIIKSIAVEGVDPASLEDVMKVLSLKKEEPYRTYMLRSDENAIANLFAERGHPYVTVEGKAILDSEKKKAAITFSVQKGTRVQIGNISISGNFKTRRKVITRNFPLKTGDPFSLKQYLLAQQKLRKLDIFESVRFRAVGLKEKRETVQIFVEIEEKKPYFFNAGSGYETDRGFYAESEVGDRNFLGSNKDVWIGGTISDIESTTYAGIHEPSLLGSKISTNTELSLKREKPYNQDTGREIISGKHNFFRPLSTHWNGALSFGYERRDQFLRSGAAAKIDEQALLPRGIIVTTPQATYDLRDSFIRPQRGAFTNLSVDFSKGIENALDDFVKLRWDGRVYYTPISHLTLALLSRVGYMQPYGDESEIPDDQLFFLGGTRSVRGFEENLLRYDNNKAIGGYSSIMGSFETRIDLGWSFEFTIFFDSGCIQDIPNPDRLLDEEFRSSAGVGFSYHTPIGPIGLFYGIKLDPQPEEEKGNLHFSVGYTF